MGSMVMVDTDFGQVSLSFFGSSCRREQVELYLVPKTLPDSNVED